MLHGPAALRGITDVDREVWEAMETLQRTGKVRLLGVSNVSLDQLRTLAEISSVPIAFVQNRCYARMGWDRDVRAFCKESGIVYQGFSLLTANERELASSRVAAIAKRHGKSVAQIAFRFALEVGMLPLTGSSSASHLREDLACFDFELDDAEVDAIERLSG